MKVLYVIDYGTIGGATHSFLELVSVMKRLGVEPVVCLGKKTDITRILEKEDIQYICAGHRTVLENLSFKGIRWPLRLIKIYLKYIYSEIIAKYRLNKYNWSEIDLIHTNSARNDIGCYINKKYRIPHIMHIREFADSDFGCIPLKRNYIRDYNEYTNLFISISEAVKIHWIKKGIYGDKIQVVYNGIHFEDITKSSDDDKYKSFKMFMAGGVLPTKGQHLVVEALGLLPESIKKNICFDVAGWYDKKYVDKMKKYADTRGYGGQIHFLGSINNVHERLGSYQVGLMCSRSEGFGRVTAEYMHAQLGIIASDSGANPELIEDGVTGLLFKSGDAKSLADCIIRFYNNRELLIQLSHAAREKARREYTQHKNAENIYKIYQEILKKQ